MKPENVMIRDDGIVKVLDFGIAKRRRGGGGPDPSTERSELVDAPAQGGRVGTPMYMAPEQLRGEALDGRADQFAWGVVAYELRPESRRGRASAELDIAQTGAGTLTVSAGILGTSTSLAKSGSGTLVLTGANTYTGATNINGGTLQIGAGGAAGALGTGAVANGGTLIYDLTGTTSWANVITARRTDLERRRRPDAHRNHLQLLWPHDDQQRLVVPERQFLQLRLGHHRQFRHAPANQQHIAHRRRDHAQ